MKKNQYIPLIIFTLIAVAFCLPVFRDIHSLGYGDWDQFTFWNAVPRDTILRYGQFPLWNPYVNGGNVLLAHPDSPFLSPLFVFVLLFGPVIGLKLLIPINLIIGLAGMFRLAEHLRLNERSMAPCYLSAFVYMLSSVYALKITEGQTEWFSLALAPWIFLFYLKSFINKKNIVPAIFLLGLAAVYGVYVFSIFIVFLSLYAVLKSVQQKNLKPGAVLISIFAGTFFFGAIKLLPLLEFISKYPRAMTDAVYHAWPGFINIFLNPEQAILDKGQWDDFFTHSLRLVHGWHEYGAYIGFLSLALVIMGVIKSFKSSWPLIATTTICFFIAMGKSSPVPLWILLQKFPVYSSLTVPSRFIFPVAFGMALVAGYGLLWLEERFFECHKLKLFGLRISYSAFLAAIVLADLILVNGPIFNNAFGLRPLEIPRQETFAQRFDSQNLYGRKFISRSSTYPIFLSNSGLLDGYECIFIYKGRVKTVSDPDYKGEAYLVYGNGSLLIDGHTPNRISIRSDSPQPDKLVLNQNYHSGWRVKIDGVKVPVEPFNGLISTIVSTGQHKIEFYYLPLSFIVGSIISVIFIFSAVIFYLKKTDLK